MGRTKKNRNVAKAATATLAAAAILLTGTFAWQSISQKALNEAVVDVNPGGRLHDDFNGKNKDVYVENFTSEEDGEPIYARIRLDEYMEIGAEAGTAPSVDEDGNVKSRRATSVITGDEFGDVDTWSTYLPDQTDPTKPAKETDNEKIHEYWDWTLGGSTVYMPTFNKNKDSLEAEINGTFAGRDQDPATDADQYLDYVSYKEETKKTDTAVLDNDDNDIDEVILETAEEPENIITVTETHTAGKTIEGTVISMEKWLENPAAGDYWVYDEDGWAYWANPIEPGTATGLLLSQINMTKIPDNNWYYGINVVAQFATKGDWGYDPDVDKGTGFYDLSEGTAPTDNALRLLGVASGMEEQVVIIGAGNVTTAAPGGDLDFTAVVKAADVELQTQPLAWTWSVANADGAALAQGTKITNGTLTVDAAEARGTVLLITAAGTLSTDDGATTSTVTGTVKVTVYEELTITMGAGETAAPGKEITLSAASKPSAAEEVRWTVSGRASTGTIMTKDETDGSKAVLTIAEDEAVKELTVKVEYLNAGKVVAAGEYVVKLP